MEAATLYEAGWLYGDIGQYQKALDCYSQAGTLYKALGNRKSELNTLNNTAWIYGELGEEQRALDIYEQIAEAKKKINETDPVLMSNLAASYAKMGQYQRALDTNLQVLPLRQGPGPKTSPVDPSHSATSVTAITTSATKSKPSIFTASRFSSCAGR